MKLPDYYGITHAHQIGVAAQLDALKLALTQGLRLVQLREAALPMDSRLDFLPEAVALCHQHGARVLINGDVPYALAFGEDGVHLTAAQLMCLNMRLSFPLVAASCHNRTELNHAAKLKLDFAVLGPVKPTASHPGQAGMGWARFAAQVRDLSLPVYGLGGVGRQDRPDALAAGAQGIAAIRDAWGST